MIVLSNTTAQTVEPGQDILFDRVVRKCGCGTCHRDGSASVKMCKKGLYAIHFSGNIDGATADAPAQLAIQTGGETLPETTMISSATGVNNVATMTYLKNCCCDFDRLTVSNTGTVAITVSPNTSFAVAEVND